MRTKKFSVLYIAAGFPATLQQHGPDAIDRILRDLALPEEEKGQIRKWAETARTGDLSKRERYAILRRH